MNSNAFPIFKALSYDLCNELIKTPSGPIHIPFHPLFQSGLSRVTDSDVLHLLADYESIDHPVLCKVTGDEFDAAPNARALLPLTDLSKTVRAQAHFGPQKGQKSVT